MPMSAQNPAILLVDDDPAILSLMETMVSTLGFVAQSARDGREAMDFLSAEKFEIVITDIKMPRIDGLELLAHIQQFYPQTGVIVVTGYADSVTYTDVIRAGAADFIAKPYIRDELEAKINRLTREQGTIKELERLSTFDSLTDLFNRRQFDVTLWAEAHRAHRQGYPLFVAMLDVDRFKAYNDTYGHRAGDNVLQSIGRVIERCTRLNVDTGYRYGGDEFALIIPQADSDQVLLIAARIKELYGDLGFGETGISIGTAPFVRQPGHSWSQDIEALVARADRAMYCAKNKDLSARESMG